MGCQTIKGAAHCYMSVGDSWGRLVSQWSGPWIWALLFCTWFSAWSAASAACEAVAWRQIVLVTGVRSEPCCSAFAGACWSSMLERHATEHCSSLSGIVLDYMQASEPSPASKGVWCAVSPGHGNYATSPLLWCASQKSVAGPGRHRALCSATDRSTPAMITDGTAGLACFNCCDVSTRRASDLSGSSCRPFCMYHMWSDVGCACSERWESGGCVVSAHGKMELCVVSILVVLYAMPGYDVTHWTAVDGKQDGFQYRSWGTPTLRLTAVDWWLPSLTNWPAAEVRPEPRKHSSY